MKNVLFPSALAEILSKKELADGSTHYYVHYIDCEYCVFWLFSIYAQAKYSLAFVDIFVVIEYLNNQVLF